VNATGDDKPRWARDLDLYQREQARLLELGVWPLETALRFRAIASAITAELATLIVESIHKRRQENDAFSFPFISTDDVAKISRVVTLAMLAGSWIQQGRASDYLDNHPNRSKSK